MDQAILVALVMLVCVLTMLVLGIPISISIGLASTIAMLFVLPFENAMGTAAQKVFTGVNSFSLLAIPFFILAGNIMNNGGIAIRLVNCAKILSGRMPGALAETNVVANMLFGAISGSGVAAAAAIGGTIGPLEEKEGYSKDYMAAVNIASAPTGMLIPPSNTLIVYSTVAGSVSISALFMAGYLPGLLWGIGVMVIAGIMASRRGYRNRDEITLAIVLKTVWAAIPSLLLIVIVIGGILIGAFTATEGSAIAVVYSLLLSFIYRSIKIRDLRRILLDSVKMTEEIQTFGFFPISKPKKYPNLFLNLPDLQAIQNRKGLDIFYDLFAGRPQNSRRDPSLFFHFFSTLESPSPSSVANAFASSSVVISRYTMVVSSCSCPSRKEICTMFMPSSNQWEAFAWRN